MLLLPNPSAQYHGIWAVVRKFLLFLEVRLSIEYYDINTLLQLDITHFTHQLYTIANSGRNSGKSFYNNIRPSR
ncbi:hypothetical protein DHD32_20790 [Arenibacter sp. TNZ]|nr:hypothetical protein [Arenibacter sp. TNZ]